MLLPALAAACLAQDSPQAPKEPPALGADAVRSAARVIGLDFDDAELELMLDDVVESLRSFERMQAIELANSRPPAFIFDPRKPVSLAEEKRVAALTLASPRAERPADLEELAFADISTLAALIRSRQVSCVELAELSLARLRRLDPTLLAVVNLTEERAIATARRLDAELAAGHWRGSLHGIPYGAKDLLAARGAPTTWGSPIFREQVLDLDAAVIQRLEEAGAVLVAKLSLGELAWGDVWFGGMTRNPWKIEQGSSGSSAGASSAVAAGCVPFAIGSETLGSIVSPADRCGCSALRPTFGAVSRAGSMTLAWTMDKLGPICRSALDASIVYASIAGEDEQDPSTRAYGFQIASLPSGKGMTLAIPEGSFDGSPEHRHVLDELRTLEFELRDVELPRYPTSDMLVILSAEAATAFDALTRDGRDGQMVRQVRRAWPNVFRVARLIPAVEYLRASRLRAELVREMHALMEHDPILVHPSFAADVLTITNLTGQPTVVLPCGFREDGTPFSISFTGRVGDETSLLAVARLWQESTDYHRRRPPLK